MSYSVKNTSWWEQTELLTNYDFLIVGAGFTGRYIALGLAEKYPKANIALVDRSPFSAGASSRNAGFATFGNVTEMIDDLKTMSEAEVVNLISDRYEGLNWIRKNFKEADFDFRLSGGWEIFENKQQAENAFDAMQQMNRLMLEATGQKELFAFGKTQQLGFTCYENGIYNAFEGMLNPGRLLKLINKKIKQHNIEVLSGLEVTSVENGIVQTSQGYEINSSQVILATNAFTSSLLPKIKHQIVPARGQVFVTKPLKKPLNEGIYHCDDGYIYFRSLGERLLIGGGRNKFFEQETNSQIETNAEVINYLMDFVRTVVTPTEQPEIETTWSGIMAMGGSKSPVVERVDSQTILCARMGGIGVALSPIAAKKAVGLL